MTEEDLAFILHKTNNYFWTEKTWRDLGYSEVDTVLNEDGFNNYDAAALKSVRDYHGEVINIHSFDFDDEKMALSLIKAYATPEYLFMTMSFYPESGEKKEEYVCALYHNDGKAFDHEKYDFGKWESIDEEISGRLCYYNDSMDDVFDLVFGLGCIDNKKEEDFLKYLKETLDEITWFDAYFKCRQIIDPLEISLPKNTWGQYIGTETNDLKHDAYYRIAFSMNDCELFSIRDEYGKASVVPSSDFVVLNDDEADDDEETQNELLFDFQDSTSAKPEKAEDIEDYWLFRFNEAILYRFTHFFKYSLSDETILRYDNQSFFGKDDILSLVRRIADKELDSHLYYTYEMEKEKTGIDDEGNDKIKVFYHQKHKGIDKRILSGNFDENGKAILLKIESVAQTPEIPKNQDIIN